MKTGSDEAAGGCFMFRAVWPTHSGNRALIGVVLGQRGESLLAAGLEAAKQLADRLAPHAAIPATSGIAGVTSAGRPGPAPPGAYRPRIENPIRAGNTPSP